MAALYRERFGAKEKKAKERIPNHAKISGIFAPFMLHNFRKRNNLIFSRFLFLNHSYDYEYYFSCPHGAMISG